MQITREPQAFREKERGTIEALVYTPLADIELYTSKLLTAWIPALPVTLVGGLLYSIVSNVAAYPILGEIFLPNTLWLILVLWVAPAAAGFGLAAMVLVSSRADSFQEAYQPGGLVVLPVVALMLGQLAGVVYLSTGLLILVGVALWLIDGLLLWYGASTFQRSEIIARLA